MAATKEEIKELAEHIYDLDAEVYVHLGSSLGRVFNRDRERCVNELTELLTTRPQGHLVRSELCLCSEKVLFQTNTPIKRRITAYENYI
jgi:hypothetical protein